MIQKPIQSLTETDINTLHSEKVAESRTLDYKRELPGSTDKEKKEFLADVCAFANANGGDMIFGIDEERDQDGKPTGIPKVIEGIDVTNFDATRLAMETSIRTGIAPRIPKFDFQPIGAYSKGPVILLRIQQSWAQPHWVTYQKDSPFYTRGGGGKYPMDIGQIRAAFNLSMQLDERVQKFRATRSEIIMSGNAPRSLNLEKPIAILHVIPALSWSGDVDLNSVSDAEAFRSVRPLMHSGWNHRFNFDGVVSFGKADTSNGMHDGYTQFFRQGIVEIVSQPILTQPNDAPEVYQNAIPSTVFEAELINGLTNAIKFLKSTQVPLPYFVGLSLFGVKGLMMSTRRAMGSNFDPEPIDRNSLIVPDFRYDENVISDEKFMYPILNYIWRASGFAGSPNFHPVTLERINY